MWQCRGVASIYTALVNVGFLRACLHNSDSTTKNAEQWSREACVFCCLCECLALCHNCLGWCHSPSSQTHWRSEEGFERFPTHEIFSQYKGTKRWLNCKNYTAAVYKLWCSTFAVVNVEVIVACFTMHETAYWWWYHSGMWWIEIGAYKILLDGK